MQKSTLGFFGNKLSAALILMIATGCTSTPPADYSATPVAPAVAKQQMPVPISQTQTTEKTTISDDGSTITTEQTTTTIGFDPAKAAAALAAPASPATNSGLIGQWQMVSSSSGASCSLAFYGAPAATEGKATSNCPSGFLLNGITGWAYQNGQLNILKGTNVALTLNQLGPTRFDGVASNGFISTTITLKR